jgi:hypothetical protein
MIDEIHEPLELLEPLPLFYGLAARDPGPLYSPN